MLDVASPPARRTKQATWLDPRLLGGVLLILVSLVVGARVVAGADKTTPIYAAARDLSAGHVLTAGDLQIVKVRLDGPTADYLAGDQQPVGRILTREVRTGELVAASVVVADTPAPFRDVSVSVKPEHIAANVIDGSRVDVIATSTTPGSGPRTWTVAKNLEVVARSKSASGFATSDARVVLKVPAALVLPLTAALRSAEVDVVRVPSGIAPGDIGDVAPAVIVAPTPSAGVPAPASTTPTASAGATPAS